MSVNTLGDSLSASYGIETAASPAANLSDAQQMENNFITLMVAQINNQDPTKPVDSTEFLNQFSAMSQVKSMENMATISKSNLVLMDNMQTLTAAGLVGQEVRVSTSSVTLGDEPLSARINLTYAAADTQLTLTDSSGKSKTISLGSHEAGPVDFTLDAEALGLAPGQYVIGVNTDSGEFPSVEVAGLVNKVRVSSEGPVLDVVGAGEVPFYNITEFGQAQVAGLL